MARGCLVVLCVATWSLGTRECFSAAFRCRRHRSRHPPARFSLRRRSSSLVWRCLIQQVWMRSRAPLLVALQRRRGRARNPCFAASHAVPPYCQRLKRFPHTKLHEARCLQGGRVCTRGCVGDAFSQAGPAWGTEGEGRLYRGRCARILFHLSWRTWPGKGHASRKPLAWPTPRRRHSLTCHRVDIS